MEVRDVNVNFFKTYTHVNQFEYQAFKSVF